MLLTVLRHVPRVRRKALLLLYWVSWTQLAVRIAVWPIL
ncbi:hypothetical protein EVA_16370 [gut metagenome]|uniref:Uncharacterized protein n=1 Tax=gut metagenome TaxID=749906 RepID=J9FM88_9ZZZZ